jgi:branched-chain amino acid transport system substrate-binding protein
MSLRARLPSVTARRRAALGAFTSVVLASCAATASAGPPPIRVGAIFPLSGATATDAGDEYLGATIAAQMVNAGGGVRGRRISLDTRDVESTGQIPAAVASLRRDGTPVVIGAYASELSIPAAAAVAGAGMVYWETGAVADQVTGQGSPLVFRVGANGADLGGNSGRFVLQQLLPRIGLPARSVNAFLVTADDAYAHSVADGARAALATGGVPIAGEAVYNPYVPQWAPVIAQIKATRPRFCCSRPTSPTGSPSGAHFSPRACMSTHSSEQRWPSAPTSVPRSGRTPSVFSPRTGRTTSSTRQR